MESRLATLLKKRAKTRYRPDESGFTALELTDALALAKEFETSLYEVEKAALEHNILPLRFARNQRILSLEDQKKLHDSRVAVVGLGGLGGGVTELLARVGIGNLVLIDGDVFDETNLNRQHLSSVSNLGTAKAAVAAKRVEDINPAVRIRAEYEFLDEGNGEQLLSGSEIVVDCLDTIAGRFILAAHCKKLGLPMVSAAIGGRSGQATVIPPGETTLEKLYGSPEKAPGRGVEAGLGTLGFTAQFMGAIEVAEVVNILLGKSSTLQNCLLFTDLDDYSFERIEGM